MQCDLIRLHAAIDAATEKIAADWRQSARIAGHKVPEPVDDGELDDEDFNDQMRSMMARFAAASEG